MKLDHTHDLALRSWVPGANGHVAFPIQNLPLGLFRPQGGAPRGGVAIGNYILDLRLLHESSDLATPAVTAGAGASLNALLALGEQHRVALRHEVSALLSEGAAPRPALLHKSTDCVMERPAHIGDYSDFYAGIHHANAVGTLFRPDSPLFDNYKWIPIGYHGRASSVGVTGHVHRPNGQRKPATESVPSFGPSRNLDYELELGIWIGPGKSCGSRDTDWQSGSTYRRLLLAERLVGAGYSGVGIPAARAVSCEELLQHDQPLDYYPRGSCAISGGAAAAA